MSEQDLLQFPCDFPIKVMGERRDDFAETIVAVVLSHAPDFDTSAVEMRASSSNRYLSLTCTVRATSREQLDSLYLALTSHPMVKVVL
jgi:putative lipoic acid-binding regulatory protein